MSRELRIALVVAFVCAVALLTAALVLSGPEPLSEPPARAAGGASTTSTGEASAVVEEAERVVAEEEAERAREAESEHAGEEGEVSAGVLTRERRALDGAEPVARRFFAAFARYELGEDSDAVADVITATVTPALARELGRPPRIPPGVAVPKRAALAGRLQLVALDGTPAELTEAELVGALERGGERSAVSLRMVRDGGRWRVAALGR